MFHKLLIANRGEIACRIIRTAKALNIKTVAVYSTADADALHVKMADEAVLIGEPPATQSYLNIEKIIQAAKKTKAEAIHPGYGFLSENAEFARAVNKANLIFVGPPATAIANMGSKAQAKILMEKAKVPLIPGYHGDKQDQTTLTEHAQKIGFPLLIKASHGGGGKGMRVVNNLGEFTDKLAACQREAAKSFGSDEVILEKYLTKPRHIEIQVFVDAQGNGVYLFERDCSIQRRHQKIVEEAPGIRLTPETRKAMGEAAVRAAKSINYQGAGTIEFLYSEGDFYFMEMNTRLQVEHPVTEAITGEDLVAWQLMIAAGSTLPKQQKELQVNGHAIELRIYAEDPLNQFLPATGKIEYLHLPKIGRVDHGIQTNDQVSIHYDPMLAKLIIHGEDRAHCISETKRALADFHIIGVTTNIPFLAATLEQEAYQDGQYDTHFIEDNERLLQLELNRSLPLAMSVASQFALTQKNKQAHFSSNDIFSPWHENSGWRSLSNAHLKLTWYYRDEAYEVEVCPEAKHTTFKVNGHPYDCTFSNQKEHHCDLAWENEHFAAYCRPCEEGFFVSIGGFQYTLEHPTHHLSHEHESKGNQLTAPMPGIIRKIFVNSGAEVLSEAPLLILEAMKMEHTLTAPIAGKVTTLNFKEGDTVEEGALLLALDTGEQ